MCQLHNVEVTWVREPNWLCLEYFHWLSHSKQTQVSSTKVGELRDLGDTWSVYEEWLQYSGITVLNHASCMILLELEF